MGITYVDGEAAGADGRRVPVRFLVDSGAVYSLLPEAAWKSIGLHPMRRQTFTLADGTTVERSVSECRLVVPQGEATSPVILGEAGDEALLGVVTLEILGLVLNPFSRTLQPMRAMLAQSAERFAGPSEIVEMRAAQGARRELAVGKRPTSDAAMRRRSAIPRREASRSVL